MAKALIYSTIAISILLVTASCSSTESYPRPRGFHRLELPERRYQQFSSPHCPCTFEYPAYGRVEMVRTDSCYFNVFFDRFDTRWYVTTRFLMQNKINPTLSMEDHRDLVYKHTVKGAIQDMHIKTSAGSGFLYELYGDVPTPLQFYFSDNDRYAMMAAFYFNTAQKNDSLAPVIQFLKTDMEHMLQTTRWKE